FLQLEMAAYSAESRAFFEGRKIHLVGQFSGTGTEFTLLRLKWNCCAADAVPLKAAMIVDTSKGQTLNAKKYHRQWVQVTGRVRFARNPTTGAYYPPLFLSPTAGEKLSEMVELIETPADPYLK